MFRTSVHHRDYCPQQCWSGFIVKGNNYTRRRQICSPFFLFTPKRQKWEICAKKKKLKFENEKEERHSSSNDRCAVKCIFSPKPFLFVSFFFFLIKWKLFLKKKFFFLLSPLPPNICFCLNFVSNCKNKILFRDFVK